MNGRYGIVSIAALFLAALAACSEKNVQSADALQAHSEPAAPTHFYDVQDGMEYGYTLASTSNDQAGGVAGHSVAMLMYAGERDGKYQIHMKVNGAIQAWECTKPCELFKIITVVDVPDLPPGTAHVARFKPAPNAVAMLALQDAWNGQLKTYGEQVNGRVVSVWVDEHRGVVRRPVPAH